MIFRSEASGHHYIFNGEDVIDFTPNPKQTWDGPTEKVEEAFNNARKKGFITSRGRHIVVSRGTFIDN